MKSLTAAQHVGGLFQHSPRAAPVIADTFRLANTTSITFPLTFAPIGTTLRQLHEFDIALFNMLKEATSKGEPIIQRSLAIQAIADYGHVDGLPVLRAIAVDPEEPLALRTKAINGLALIRAPNVIKVLVQLYNEIPDLRNQVIIALGNVRQPEAVPELYQALDHTSWAIRRAAVQSLGLIADPSSVQQLEKTCTDEDEDVRKQVALALGIIGSAAVIDPLRRLCRDTEHEVRVAALESLDFDFPDDARATFIELANDRAYLDRTKAIEMLGYYRFPDVRNTLLNLCADVDEGIREGAVESLRRIDQELTRELHYVPLTKRHRFVLVLLRRLGRWLHIDEFFLLTRQAQLQRTSEQETGNSSVALLIIGNPELERKFRLLTVLALGFFVCLVCFTPGILTAMVTRLTLYLSRVFWRNKWMYLALIGAALVSFLPGIRRGKQVHILGLVYTLVRFLGLAILLVLAGAAIFQYWQVSMAVILLIVALLFVGRKRIMSKVKPAIQGFLMRLPV